MTAAENHLDSSNEAPDLVNRDDEHYSIEEGYHLVENASYRVQNYRYGVVKDGKIVNMLLDPSKTQFLCTIKCNVHEVIQTTREYFKLSSVEEVIAMPQTTKECIKRCVEINPENLQYVVSPKSLDSKQEEWLRCHERLNHLPCAKMKLLEKRRYSFSHVQNYMCCYCVPITCLWWF